MIISWNGKLSFFIKAKTPEDVIICVGPENKKEAERGDIILMSEKTKEKFDSKKLVVSGAGEYEAKNIFICSVVFDENFIYRIEAEGINISYLGKIKKNLPPEVIEKMGQVDILMVPVGGLGAADAETASQIVSQFEPKIVIPMNYGESGLDDASRFLKIMSTKEPEVLDKLKISKKDLGEITRIIVLNK